MKTLGGKQLWTDHLHVGGWRIQRHALTGHYRLLDPRDFRHMAGSLSDCRGMLDRITREECLPAETGDVVIVLHGLFRSRHSMAGMARYLREDLGACVFNFEYASTRSRVAEHARALANVVAYFAPTRRVHFVGHSLGGLIVRSYLHSRYQVEAATGQSVGPVVGRTVMLGTPNLGTELARRLGRFSLVRHVWGQSGNQMARDFETLQSQLATPRTDFGLIAGQSFGPPWLSSPGDLVVTVQETQLPGAADFLVVRSVHSCLMDKPAVQSATACFLRNGYFRSDEERCPISLAPRVGDGSIRCAQ